MNTRTYALNADHAKQGDSNSGRITETGQYVGKFTRAEAVTSKKGTEGVEFAFESDDGQSADYLTLWTYNTDGKELFGLKFLNAIMTCMKVKAMTPKKATVEKWDASVSQRVPVETTVFPELMDKPIGLLLQREQYLKNDGGIGEKMGIVGMFEAATLFTASEILDKAKTPEKLAKKALQLKDKLIDSTQKARVPAPAPAGGGSIADMDDDIPF